MYMYKNVFTLIMLQYVNSDSVHLTISHVHMNTTYTYVFKKTIELTYNGGLIVLYCILHLSNFCRLQSWEVFVVSGWSDKQSGVFRH